MGESEVFGLTWVLDPSLLCQGWNKNPKQYPIWGGHKGYDFLLTYQPVPNFCRGKVKTVATSKSWGKYIIVAFDAKHEIIYAHLSEFKVKVGQVVEVRDILGISGATGSTWRADGSKEPFPHLHVGVMVNGVWVDPGPLFVARVPTIVVQPIVALTPGQGRIIARDGLKIKSVPEKLAKEFGVLNFGAIVTIKPETKIDGGIKYRRVLVEGWMGESQDGEVFLEMNDENR